MKLQLLLQHQPLHPDPSGWFSWGPLHTDYWSNDYEICSEPEAAKTFLSATICAPFCTMKMPGFPQTPFYLDSSDHRKIPERGREMPGVGTMDFLLPILTMQMNWRKTMRRCCCWACWVLPLGGSTQREGHFQPNSWSACRGKNEGGILDRE